MDNKRFENSPESTADTNESSASQPAVEPLGVGFVTSRFVEEIDSLAETLPLAMFSIETAYKNARSRFFEFISSHAVPDDDGKGLVIRTDDYFQFQKLQRQQGRTSASRKLVPRSFLVNLVSQYDAFLGRLIQTLFLIRPELLSSSDRSISFAELVAFGSVEAARDHIIEKEVESVLRKSHAEQFEWLENRFSIKLRKDLPIWPEFIEVTERRNLFVHTGGEVSSQYLKNCKEHGATAVECAKGQRLDVDSQYFKRAHHILFEMGVKLAQVLWRKLAPTEIEEADETIVTISYDLLTEKRYELAKVLLDFAVETVKKHSSENSRLKLQINRVQAYKWTGNRERASALLSEEDFSAASDQFQLADSVLRDDFRNALRLVRKIGNCGSLSLGAYREWPLFQELRKQENFKEAIVEIFGEPLNKTTVKTDQAQDSNPGKTP